MTLKVAIVGCGKIADGHLAEVGKLAPLARVVAVCDRELLMAEQAALRYGIEAFYDDFQALLSERRPDVVHILTPPAAHLEIARTALEAGCHVFVEKPVAPRAPEVAQLVDAVQAAGRKLTVGYTYVFDPPARRVRQLIQDGKLGEVVHVESFYGYDLASPFGSALMRDPHHWVHRLPGKLVQNNIDHLLNKLVDFFPTERPTIHSVGLRRRSARFGDHRDDCADEVRVLMTGERVTAHALFSAHARPSAHFLKVYGTRASARVDFVTRTVAVSSASALPGPFGRLAPPLRDAVQLAREGFRNTLRFARSEFQFFAGLNCLLEAFYRSILNDTPPPIPYAHIVRVSEWIDEVIDRSEPQSARSRSRPLAVAERLA